MKFTYFWPLFLILLVPIIILMYILKQKAKEQDVPSLFLWSEMVKNDRANTPWEKLKKDILMILQIITLLVLIFALMSPFVFSKFAARGKVCVIIDTSASMSFNYDENQTRIEKAKEEAINYIKNLRSGTQISVITSDRSSLLLAANYQDKSDVIEIIKNINASAYAGDASAGIEMAKSLDADSSELECIILTDTSIDVDQMEATVVDVYSEVENVGIEYVSHGYNSNNELTVLVKVKNYGTSESKRDVSLYQGDKLVDFKEVTIAAGESEVVYFENVNIDAEAFFAQLSQKDGCDSDNICYDVLKEEKESRVLLMTKANVYLESALNLIPNISVTKSEDIDSFDSFANQNYDLYIFDSMLPANMPNQGNVIIFGMDCDEIARIDGVYQNVYIYGEETDTTQYLDALTFGAAGTYSYKTPEYATPFLVYTETDENGNEVAVHDIAFVGSKEGRTYAMIGFDLHDSTLPLQMEFPVLMYNLITECVKSGVLNNYVFSGGDNVYLSGDVNATLPIVEKPDGSIVELSDYRCNFSSTDQYGVYNVKQTKNENEDVSSFAVNFPATESNILSHPSLIASEDDNVVTEVKGVFNLRNFIIALALVLLAVEWIASLRR